MSSRSNGAQTNAASSINIGEDGGGGRVATRVEYNTRESPSFLPTKNKHFFSMLAYMGPYTIIGFFVVLSIFNSNIKGIVYFIGFIILYFCSTLIQFEPTTDRDNMPFGMLVYGYTFSYLLFPMIQFSMMNYPLLVSMLCLMGVDVAYMSKTKFNINKIAIAFILSMLLGFFWSLIVSRMSPSMLYSTDYLSDKQVCSIPSEQTFKCKVYKNGELISTMTR
jgi:hypothetical protein